MEALSVQTSIKAPIEKVWKCWTTPVDIIQWNNPSEDWETTSVTIDLNDNGAFIYKMKAKDGSVAFDFTGIYDKVIINEYIESTLFDGRKVVNIFKSNGDETILIETFDPEAETPIPEQEAFTQAVIDNFKKYVEGV